MIGQHQMIVDRWRSTGGDFGRILAPRGAAQRRVIGSGLRLPIGLRADGHGMRCDLR